MVFSTKVRPRLPTAVPSIVSVSAMSSAIAMATAVPILAAAIVSIAPVVAVVVPQNVGRLLKKWVKSRDFWRNGMKRNVTFFIKSGTGSLASARADLICCWFCISFPISSSDLEASCLEVGRMEQTETLGSKLFEPTPHSKCNVMHMHRGPILRSEKTPTCSALQPFDM